MRIRLLNWLNLLIACLLLLLAPVALAQTDSVPVVEENRHKVSFGESLWFHLTASSSSTDIASAVLTYQTSDNQGMTIKQLGFSPNSRVKLTHEVDLARHPLKPFVEVTYWWTVNDIEGRQVITEPKSFFYQDPRFEEMPALSGQHVVVHWYEGDAAFGSRALDIADQAVDRIRKMLDSTLALPEPFHLYLYASKADLLPALPASGREWVVGQAYPELRVALAVIPPGTESTPTMRWLIPHELTHLLLYEAMGNKYGRLPPWLNEGLAVFSKQVPDPDEELVLDQAAQSSQLLPLATLCHSPPFQDDRARLAYAQSASVVRFIQENYGRSTIGRLVTAYGDGLSCQSAVRRTLGISLNGLESQWRRSLGSSSQNGILLKQAMPWMLLVLVSLPLLILVLQPLATRQTERRHKPLI